MSETGEKNEQQTHHIEKQQTWQQKVQNLTAIVANDSKLKKDKRVKYQQYKKNASELWDQKRQNANEKEYILLAGLYKNLGKMGDSQDCLEKSLVLLRKGKGPAGRIIKWVLQLIAHKSSLKKHKQCFQLAKVVIKDVKNVLEGFLKEQSYQQDHKFIRIILKITQEIVRDEIIWKHNDKAIEQALLQKLRRQNPEIMIPYFGKAQFHIADIMTLETCRDGWIQKPDCNLQALLTFLSIGFFTLATQTYYMGDYSHKHEHIRSIKLALVSFDLRCTYVIFLLKILRDHFEQKMQEIPEQRLINGEHNELMRLMPKEIKQISLANLSLPQ